MNEQVQILVRRQKLETCNYSVKLSTRKLISYIFSVVCAKTCKLYMNRVIYLQTKENSINRVVYSQFYVWNIKSRLLTDYYIGSAVYMQVQAPKFPNGINAYPQPKKLRVACTLS